MQKLLKSKNKNQNENAKQNEKKNENSFLFSCLFLFSFYISFSFLFSFSISFPFLFSFSLLTEHQRLIKNWCIRYLNGLVFPVFPRFWLFPQNIYHGTYYEISYPQNLICAKYQVKTFEKWIWMAKVDLGIFDFFFSLNNNMK